jgi:hypothetical protein
VFGAEIHVGHELQTADTLEITRILFGNAVCKHSLGNQTQKNAAQQYRPNSPGPCRNSSAAVLDDLKIMPGQDIPTPVSALNLFNNTRRAKVARSRGQKNPGQQFKHRLNVPGVLRVFIDANRQPVTWRAPVSSLENENSGHTLKPQNILNKPCQNPR